MSYLSPTSWTDVDYAGNPLDWTSRTNKMLYPAYEMLRLSSKERRRGVNREYVTGLGNELQNNSLISRDLLVNIYSQGLYFYYLDCSEDEVQFYDPSVGGGGIIPPNYKWWYCPPDNDPTDLLAFIGDDELVPFNMYGRKVFNASWEEQTYKIINACRWGCSERFLAAILSRVNWAPDHSTFSVNHLIPSVANDGYFPTHLWEIWVSEYNGLYYGMPHKIITEWISSPMAAGDTHTSSTLISSDTFYYPMWLGALQHAVFYEIFKYDYGNDFGAGFQFYDWTPKLIPI
jgi:hypothetical protein